MTPRIVHWIQNLSGRYYYEIYSIRTTTSYVHYRLDVELLKSKGIPAGPLYGQLKSGKTITHNGVTVQPEDVVGPPRPGKKIGMWGSTATFKMIFQDQSLNLSNHVAVISMGKIVSTFTAINQISVALTR